MIVFSLPGAFTPTCSSTHLPRYNELQPVFKNLGVDEIVCVSVNDTFVMNAWKDDQKADKITFIPDGNGEFTDGMGMLVGKEDLGFGKRSWRYSMLVKDSVVEKMFIEPNRQVILSRFPMPTPCLSTWIRTSGSRVRGLVHQARLPIREAKQLLIDNGIQYEEIILGKDATTVSLRAVTGRTSVPQVFIGGQHIGGSDELETYLAK